MKLFRGRVRSYVLDDNDGAASVESLASVEEPTKQTKADHDGGNNVESLASSFEEPQQKGSFIENLVSMVSSKVEDWDDTRGDVEDGYNKSECDERFALEPSDSIVIPDIEVEYGKSRDAISFPDYIKPKVCDESIDEVALVKSPSRGASIGKSRSFLGSILKSQSRGESVEASPSLEQEPSGLGLDNEIVLVKSRSFGESKSFLGSISKRLSRGESTQASPSLYQQPSGLEQTPGVGIQASSGPRLEETSGVAIQASPIGIVKEDEAKGAANEQDAMSIGIQASPSKIARGDDPTVISDQGVGFEVEIKPTSNLETPHHPEVENNKEEIMSHTSTITDTAAGESIPTRIDVQKKDLKPQKSISQLAYFRQLGAAKETKPKKPSKNIFGLRRKGDPYHSDKTAARQANRNFIGLRPSSKFKPYYGNKPEFNRSKVSKSSRLSKSSKQDVSKRLRSYCIAVAATAVTALFWSIS